MPMTRTLAVVDESKHLRGHDQKEIRRDRHSASPTSHCVASHTIKKEGAGGKFTWGDILESESPQVTQKRDPNYVSSDENDISEYLSTFVKDRN